MRVGWGQQESTKQKKLSEVDRKVEIMVRGVGMQSSSGVVLFGAARAQRGQFSAANDNENKPPVMTVTVRRKLEKSGVAIKIKVPVSEYFGVAVSTSITDEGVLSSAIELVHEDKDLNYRVFQEIGNSDVVAEWQNWGRKLRLPLYIKSGDGNLMPYSQQVDGVVVGNETSRRQTVNQSNRRPRFLNRRKPGSETA